MTRPPHAREKVLDAYCRLLREDGERAATMEAIAAAAGVSKGGLLYHFPSKEALAEALIARFEEIAALGLAEMEQAEEGPARNFVRTSVHSGTEMDHYFAAVHRLAQAANEAAIAALESAHAAWLDLIRAEVGDDHAAEAIMLIGEGLYYHSTMPGSWSRGTFAATVEPLLAQVERLRSGA